MILGHSSYVSALSILSSDFLSNMSRMFNTYFLCVFLLLHLVFPYLKTIKTQIKTIKTAIICCHPTPSLVPSDILRIPEGCALLLGASSPKPRHRHPSSHSKMFSMRNMGLMVFTPYLKGCPAYVRKSLILFEQNLVLLCPADTQLRQHPVIVESRSVTCK